MELKDRERKVDLNKMSVEEVDVLSVQLGAKMKAICDEAVAKANAILNIYGASAKMQIEISELDQKMVEKMSPAPKTRKPRKRTNLKKEQTL